MRVKIACVFYMHVTSCKMTHAVVIYNLMGAETLGILQRIKHVFQNVPSVDVLV